MNQLKSYFVWDACTCWFHRINVLCPLTLMAFGIVILNASALGVSTDGKILLKEMHIWVGSLFVVSLLWRFTWPFSEIAMPDGVPSYPEERNFSKRWVTT